MSAGNPQMRYKPPTDPCLEISIQPDITIMYLPTVTLIIILKYPQVSHTEDPPAKMFIINLQCLKRNVIQMRHVWMLAGTAPQVLPPPWISQSSYFPSTGRVSTPCYKLADLVSVGSLVVGWISNQQPYVCLESCCVCRGMKCSTLRFSNTRDTLYMTLDRFLRHCHE